MAFNAQIEVLVRAKLPVPDSWNVVKPPTSVTDKNTGKTDVEGGYGVMGDTNVAAAGKTNGEKSLRDLGENYRRTFPISAKELELVSRRNNSVKPCTVASSVIFLFIYMMAMNIIFLCAGVIGVIARRAGGWKVRKRLLNPLRLMESLFLLFFPNGPYVGSTWRTTMLFWYAKEGNLGAKNSLQFEPDLNGDKNSHFSLALKIREDLREPLSCLFSNHLHFTSSSWIRF